MAKRSRGLPDGFTLGLSEEFKANVIAGRCGEIQRFCCQPRLPTEDIAPEALRPGHLDEVSGLAWGCLEAVSHVRSDVERLHGHDDDRWWLQSSLISAMNTGVRAIRFLAAGLRDEIVLTYPSSTSLTAAGVTRNNAHDLAGGIALDLVCRAWNPICVAEGEKPITLSVLLTYRSPPVRMVPEDKDHLPFFAFERLPDVANAIRNYPAFDSMEIHGKTHWENLRVKGRRASQGGTPEHEGAGPDGKGQVCVEPAIAPGAGPPRAHATAGVEVLLGEEGKKVLEIARDERLDLDRKMQDILRARVKIT